MLTENQAQAIVHASMQSVSNTPPTLVADARLEDVGITPANFSVLIARIASNPTFGVPRFQHYLDLNSIAELGVSTSVRELTNVVWKLSAGKMCSNPNNPHPQECCPYPDKCPECGFAVV
jgi:hypothetical protein